MMLLELMDSCAGARSDLNKYTDFLEQLDWMSEIQVRKYLLPSRTFCAPNSC
jgi:hypothetical protein